MTQSEKEIFYSLFQKVYNKCFGIDFTIVLTESECKHLSNEIFESTGLVLGWKSLKNYAQYLLNTNPENISNPSVASLDTLVRYIENAPRIDDVHRKKYESHYPYWFEFKEKNVLVKQEKIQHEFENHPSQQRAWFKPIVFFCLLVGIFGVFYFFNKKQKLDFSENFEELNTLQNRGWFIKNLDFEYWHQRNINPHELTLFTLKGDNFEENDSVNGIKNMLLRKVDAASFSAELHFSDFVPSKNWQQVGIILMEDTIVSSKAVRFSLGYNDFFGGYQKPPEIILQILSSTIDNTVKPEQILELPIFQKRTEQEHIIQTNLKKSALRIEKENHNFRFLYATGYKDIFAFKEIKSKELNIAPKYIGIFASSGNTSHASALPVRVAAFLMKAN